MTTVYIKDILASINEYREYKECENDRANNNDDDKRTDSKSVFF